MKISDNKEASTCLILDDTIQPKTGKMTYTILSLHKQVVEYIL